jgi:hypothetical protein
MICDDDIKKRKPSSVNLIFLYSLVLFYGSCNVHLSLFVDTNEQERVLSDCRNVEQVASLGQC